MSLYLPFTVQIYWHIDDPILVIIIKAPLTPFELIQNIPFYFSRPILDEGFHLEHKGNSG